MPTPTDNTHKPAAKPADKHEAAQPAADQMQQAEKALMQQQHGIMQNIQKLYSEMKENQALGLQDKADELESDVNRIMTAYGEQQTAPDQKKEAPKKKNKWLPELLGTASGATIGAVAAYFGSKRINEPTLLKIGALAGITVGAGSSIGGAIGGKFSGKKGDKEAAQPAGNDKLAALVTVNAELEQTFMEYMKAAQGHVQEMMASGKLPMPGMPEMPQEQPDQGMPPEQAPDQSMPGQPMDNNKDAASETPAPASAQASQPAPDGNMPPAPPHPGQQPAADQPPAALDVNEQDVVPHKAGQAVGAGAAR